jgi:hypothetical protein
VSGGHSIAILMEQALQTLGIFSVIFCDDTFQTFYVKVVLFPFINGGSVILILIFHLL